MKSTLLFLWLVLSASVAAAESSVDLNFGLSPSKSILGVSYTNGRNQFNGGLRGIAYSSRDGFFLQPGIAYNRYLTDNGFYVTAIYTLVYLGSDLTERNFHPNGQGGLFADDEILYRKGWYSDLLMAGLGKSFQFTHWGLHIDTGIGTPANSKFGEIWGLWIGGGVSYRFKLD
jgi:hypothetical protein